MADTTGPVDIEAGRKLVEIFSNAEGMQLVEFSVTLFELSEKSSAIPEHATRYASMIDLIVLERAPLGAYLSGKHPWADNLAHGLRGPHARVVLDKVQRMRDDDRAAFAWSCMPNNETRRLSPINPSFVGAVVEGLDMSVVWGNNAAPSYKMMAAMCSPDPLPEWISSSTVPYDFSSLERFDAMCAALQTVHDQPPPHLGAICGFIANGRLASCAQQITVATQWAQRAALKTCLQEAVAAPTTGRPSKM